MIESSNDSLTRLDLGPDGVKACCVNAYESDLMAMLLGNSYHPGGVELTRRLARRALRLGPDDVVADVASGQGTSALLMAEEFDAQVIGVDLSTLLVAEATRRATTQGLGDRIDFRVGDAEQLPLDDGSVTAVICECAFCTFPDKATAAREFSRVLAPGGRVGITDMVLEPAMLSDGLRTLTGWVACLADAQPLEVYAEILEDAGLVVDMTERHDETVTTMIDQIDARLRVLRMTGAHDGLGLDMSLALDLLAEARAAVETGTVGYALLGAHKP